MRSAFTQTTAWNYFYQIRLQLLSKHLLATMILFACFNAAARWAGAHNKLKQTVSKAFTGWLNIQLTESVLLLLSFDLLYLKTYRIKIKAMNDLHCTAYKNRVKNLEFRDIQYIITKQF